MCKSEQASECREQTISWDKRAVRPKRKRHRVTTNVYVAHKKHTFILDDGTRVQG
jgi:hypothetical protein